MTEYQAWKIGWNDFFEAQRLAGAADAYPARVMAQQGPVYTLWSEEGEQEGRVSGRFEHEATRLSDYPAVGDFVWAQRQADRTVILRRFSRKSQFSRKVKLGRTEEQVMAANVDRVLVMAALDQPIHPGRIERYLALGCYQHLACTLVLNKLDACPRPQRALEQLRPVVGDAPVVLVSARTGEGMEALSAYTGKGQSVVLLGASGVGKSTLLNALSEVQLQRTQAVGEAGKGRHTTTHRQMFVLPAGCLVIDTPGTRELQLWSGPDALDAVYPDIIALAQSCRFSDCTHRAEPGCEVLRAISEGQLDGARLERYRGMKQEVERLGRRQRQRASMRRER